MLAKGGNFSVAELAHRLGLSELTLQRRVADLRQAGMAVEIAGESGHIAAANVELLDAGTIRNALSDGSRALLDSLQVHAIINSTNSHLLARSAPPSGHASVCLAEWQSHGRGRRGRQWIAPLGGSLCVSVGWCFAPGTEDIPAIGLAVGVAIARSLASLGLQDVGLKWPNDLVCNDCKLGGLLAESSRKADGSVYVVTGLGLNIDLDRPGVRIEPGWSASPTDLRRCATGVLPGRNQLAVLLLDQWLAATLEFQRQGFAAFREDWASLDRLRGRQVTVHCGEQTISGSAEGVDGRGALQLRVDGQLQKFYSGETTVRRFDASAD